MNKDTEKRVKAFVERWRGRGYEKGESQPFWLDLLQTVQGVERPYDIVSFENQVKLGSTSFIDAYIEPTHTLIEQKSIDKDLRKPIPQSDGSLLTPFQQAKRYNNELPYSKRARWVVICNFREFHVYDMDNSHSEPEVILLENLEKEYYRLRFLTETKDVHLQKELEVSMKAGDIIGEIYDELLKEYRNPDSDETLKSLNVLCVRLVFCLYAEDAGIFGKHDMFHDYLVKYKPGEGDMRRALIDLFRVLNTPESERDPYLNDDLLAFPYCNGGLFADETVEIPRFNDKIAHLLLQNASLDFDWSQISPTIFGAVFESTLNPETRRSGGMHYTSIKNIHKVIDPLFLDDLRQEFESIKEERLERTRRTHLDAFHDKLASLTFLDPACGSGNFLTETYLSLRRLENEVILEKSKGESFLGFENPIKVDIHQFYGIEINDFAVSTATTALWIAESQMMSETEKIIHKDLDMLPLKSYHNIHEGNALRMDWNDVIPASELSYIMGNPPFVGHQNRNKAQIEDMDVAF
ncbi:MAG: methylase, partial [Prevotella sp.]|nr:methylase [Prevotella sp.]